MSFFCSIDKSTGGSLLHKVTLQHLPGLFSVLEATSGFCHGEPAKIRRFRRPVASKPLTLETWFATALVAASKCRKHRSQSSELQIANVFQQRLRRPIVHHKPPHITVRRRHQHTGSLQHSARELSTREELLALVDQYDTNSLTDNLPLLELPNLQQHGSDPPLLVSDRVEDCDWPPPRYKWPAQGEVQKAVKELEMALRDPNIDPDRSYHLYRALPAPRVPYLDYRTRRILLRRLGVLERKDEEAMLRYLSVVDDMKATGIPLTTKEWNCAASFAGRYVGRITEVEVESGLRLWKEMEHVAGVRASGATFNILFDMATKAGKFKLAEMIYEEMKNRGHAFNRFHYVSLIHFYGLRADGDGVRKAYKSLVEAGEIVDTVVLNCMISSLIRAYEPQAAEQVYERMKKLHEERSHARLPPNDYRKQREITFELLKMAAWAKRKPSQLKRLQNESVIAPDAQTFRILIQYLAVQAGELHKTVSLLVEMRWFGVPLGGSIFLALFKGFALHGGIRYTQWTQDRLESVWKAYLQAMESQPEKTYVGKWMVIWALRAFAKCSNKSRTLDVWTEIKDKWKPQSGELEIIKTLLRSLVEDQ
jgi:pentatricopeptide repeat protein